MMQTRIWTKAFFCSVIFHIVTLVAVTYGFGLSAASPKTLEKQYIEVELGQAPDTGLALDKQLETPEPEKVVHPRQAAAVPQAERSIPVLSSAAADGPQVQAKAVEIGNVGMNSSGAASSNGTAASREVSGSKATGISGLGTKGGSDRPYVIYGPAPQYPQDARTNGWEGTVRVKVLISETGNVQEIRLAAGSGFNSLDQAALDSVSCWRFKPACREGRPIMAWVTVPVIFELN